MYQPHSETSRDAYNSTGERITVREKVRQEIEYTKQQGITAGWIASNLGMQTGSVAARLIELERQGKILKLRRTNKNPSGKSGNVYVTIAWKYKLVSDQIIQPKCKKSKINLNAEAKEILAEVESYISMGSPIHPGSVLHSKIKAIIAHV